MRYSFDWWEVLLLVALTCVVMAMVVLVIAAIMDSMKPTFELRKDEWQCVKEEQRMRLQPMLIGKITILQPMRATVCLEYRRIAG